MLDECLKYLEERHAKDATFTYEVIIVSDGSKDGTVELAHSYSKKYSSDKLRVLALVKNRGKGGAVRLVRLYNIFAIVSNVNNFRLSFVKGMQSARGKYLLFADADGATTFSDYDKLEDEMKTLLGTPYDWQKSGIVIGSRAHLEVEAIATRSLFRTILMHGFHLLVWLFAVRRIRDTQCGFKLFTRTAANRLFKLLHLEQWAFDVELLFLAQILNIQIVEICVAWTEIEGSKITPIWTWVQMGKDLFLIWFRYAIGAWRFNEAERKAHLS